MQGLKILFLVSFVSLNTVNASTVIIGNGGEGYKIADQIYVRDLAENSIHLNPYFGDRSDINFVDEIDQNLINKLDLDRVLLNLKLNDINSILPGFVHYLIETAHFHTWSFTGDNLSLLPDDGEIIKIPYQERVQIANRSLLSVRLQNKLWKQLDRKNQVALFIHELVFALLKPIPQHDQTNLFFQSSRVARQITGLFFLEATFKEIVTQDSFVQLLKLAFDLNSTRFQKEFSINRVTLNYNDEDRLLFAKIDFLAVDKIKPIAEDVCQQISNLNKYKLYLTTLTNSPAVKVIQFQTKYGTEAGVEIGIIKIADSYVLGGDQLANNCVEKIFKRITEN